MSNLHIVCRRCNEIKGCLSDEEFTALMSTIRIWPAAYADILRRLRAGGRAW